MDHGAGLLTNTLNSELYADKLTKHSDSGIFT